MFKVIINDVSFTVRIQNDEIMVEDELWEGDLLKVGENLYHLIKDSRSYLIELVSSNGKQLQLKINGVPSEVTVQDKYDLLLEKLGMDQAPEANHQEVRAPMPGMILEVLVEKGQKVSKGDKLLILEAMKMENIIKSGGEGTVETVNVKKGMSVEKNQVLIQF